MQYLINVWIIYAVLDPLDQVTNLDIYVVDG